MGAAQSTRKITLVDDEKAGVIKLSESLAQRLRGQIEGQQGALSEKASPAAVREPVSPPPPSAVAPVPSPQIIEKAHPTVPEPLKVPDVVPISPSPPAPEPAPHEVTPEREPQVSGASPSSSVVEVPMPKPPELRLPITSQVDVTSPSSASDIDVAIRAGPGPTLAQPGGSIPSWSIYAEEAHLMVMRLREEKEQEIKKLNQSWRDKMDAREIEFKNMSQLSEEQVSSALKEVEGLFMKASCTPVCQNQQEAVMNCYQDHPRQSLRCAREVEQFTQCVDLSRLQSIMKQEAH